MKTGAWLTASAYVLMAVAMLTFRPVRTPGPFLRDFEAYWSAGAVRNAGADPYGRAIWRAERTVPGVDPTRDELLPFVGPPASLLAWSALARRSYVAAARAWFVLLVGAALALAAVAIVGARMPLSWGIFFAAAALALSFGPLSSDLALGQVALLAFLGACCTALPAPRVRALRATGTFVAMLQPNVALGLVSQLGRARRAGAIAIGLAAAYVAGAVASGWSWPIAYARETLSHQGGERFSAIQFAPAAIAYGAGAGAAAPAVAAGLAAAAVVAAVVLWRRVADPFARFAAFAALTPFAATFFHEHDLIVAYAGTAWCALHARGRVRGVALAAALLVAIDWLGLAQRPTGIAQSALLAVAAACAFAALGADRERFGGALAPLVVAALFAIGAWLALGHPAPVWPDALGRFHAPPAAAAAAVWHAEQQRSGLLAIDPVWSFLRALPLLGCALTALSVALASGVRRRDAPASR